MKYPTMEQVESASRLELCRWHRFLDSPGMPGIGKENFMEILETESRIAERIHERLRELGGFTPEISKAIGW